MQRILLATERTQFDVGAERVAIELARSAQLGLHVVMPLVSNAEYQVVAPERVAAAEAGARQALAQLADQASARGVAVIAHVREGDELWREIVDEARESRADLLVIRKVGRRGALARLLVGELVSQVAAHSTTPVLMAPADAVLWSHRVLAIVDPRADQLSTVHVAVQWAALAGAPLEVVCLVGSGAQAEVDVTRTLSHAGEIAREQGVAFEGTKAMGVLDSSMANRVRAVRADLLVLGLGVAQLAHGRLGSQVEALVGAVQCPTLLVGTHATTA